MVINVSCFTWLATRFDPFHAKTQQSSLGDSPLESKEASSSLDPQHKPKAFSFNRSKEDLKLLLKKHEDNDLEHSKIAAALRLACDPGRLVLDVINASHPFNLKGNKDIKLRVSKKSCILLLEQLRMVSPQINPDIKEEAKKVAFYWETTLAKKINDHLEVICFLQFLAAYGLASTFDADKLLVLLDADEWRKEAADLVQVLGLADKIPNFIQNLIKKEQPIEAVKYIYALDMVDKFPPVPILKDYLSNSSKKNVKQLSKKKRKSNGGQIQAIVKEVKALTAVVKCITDYKIDGISPAILKEQIVQLEKQKEEKVLIIEKAKAKITPCSSSKSKLDQQVSLSSAPTSVTAPNTELQQQSGKKRPRIHVSSEDPPKASIRGTPVVHSMQPPQQHPPGFVATQGAPYMYPPPRHYSLAGYRPNNMQFDSYNSNVSSSYRWTNVNLGHWNPVPF
ncbi:hypothetical protein P3X46_035201 [Hevea brasiliensis]|uniref:FRIGIDA-like protein n=1 Tax=Hevea brasiliensis TaxID=3981 RepID=A0ABQ9KCG0_HEVBR|nr:FRIGIDA-like protein 5 [Hevea brasiliensis]KAJ9131546.1 hypothetical protein P3X46_035201 [Hevea brasiliensis]